MPDPLPLSPATVTVNSNRVTTDCPSWRGLDLTHAELREDSIWGPGDHHLRVPYAHPDDPARWWKGTFFRVRPRRRAWRFVQMDGVWMVEKARG